jgi:2-polyprenyl-6-methoxyphenol hydroxylase-like FAD-dependent oxidoreductase
MRVAISGGSIAGLGAGVVLNRADVDVHVFERDAGPLRSTGAGLVVQRELLSLVHAAGASLPMTHCSGRRHLGFDGEIGPLQRMPQQFTSWDAVHTKLTENFPRERYHRGARVEGLPELTSDGLTVAVSGLGSVQADVLIAADGAQSPVRRLLYPELEPEYAGYVAWRGTLLEREMGSSLVQAFDNVFTFGDARSGGHALAYFIPGDDQATDVGRRRMNWVWYVGATAKERDALLLTRDGYQRRSSLGRGMAQDEVVAALVQEASSELHPLFARLVEATPDPFLQTIVDLGVPRSVVGRTVLIGDAAFVVRPHTAGGAAKAARDALAIAQVLGDARSDVDSALATFEQEQLGYGRELMDYGIQLGQRWARL